jgi:hypothetical protein
MAGLATFLKTLATNKDAVTDFKANPDAAMAVAGLSRSEVAAVKSKDPTVVRAALGQLDTDLIIIIL